MIKLKLFNNDWTTIEEFPLYEADSSGAIRDKSTKKIIKPELGCNGRYYKVNLFNGEKKVQKTIHRLIIKTFNPIPNSDDVVVDHIDHNKLNNNINNLRWVTSKVNQNREFGHKVVQILNGEEIEFDCAADCAKANGICPDTLNWHIRNHGEYNKNGIIIKVLKYGKYCRTGERICSHNRRTKQYRFT